MEPMKIKISFLLMCIAAITIAQPDYLNKEQFEKFRTKRWMVANWQIHQLADSGALVVRLKSNKKAIDILKKENRLKSAKEIENQTYNENKIIVRAFYKHYNFSKLYFIYDYSSDSLRKGYRQGFFLDSNLQRNSNIQMKENFYLLAERDDVVQSSIGFVPESEAKKITETGPPVKQAAIVIKNKYGHQLKDPFPYYVKGTNLSKYDMYVQKLVKNLKKFKEKNPRIDYPDFILPFLY